MSDLVQIYRSISKTNADVATLKNAVLHLVVALNHLRLAAGRMAGTANQSALDALSVAEAELVEAAALLITKDKPPSM